MLNLLMDNPGAKKRKKLLGRGIGSGKGKTSGRGGKGQTARSGVALNGFEGGQTPIHRRLPKRGFKSLNKITYEVINLSDVQDFINDKKISDFLDVDIIKKLGFLKGHNKQIKLLGNGYLTSKITIKVHAASSAARIAVENVGGIIDIIKV